MPFVDPRSKKPWPIRLLNRIGVEDDNQATVIVLLSVAIMLLTTFWLYSDILDTNESTPKPIDDRLLNEMYEGLEIENES